MPKRVPSAASILVPRFSKCLADETVSLPVTLFGESTRSMLDAVYVPAHSILALGEACEAQGESSSRSRRTRFVRDIVTS